MKVIKSELDYTGGGIWCAWGELEDGTIFSGSDNMGFFLWDSDVKEILNEDYPDPTFLSPDYDGSECYLKSCTDDYDEETFEIWEQVYNAHEDCVDIDDLRSELYQMHKKEEPTTVSIELTLEELGIVNELLADKSYLPEVNDIFYKVNEIYCNECEDARE